VGHHKGGSVRPNHERLLCECRTSTELLFRKRCEGSSGRRHGLHRRASGGPGRLRIEVRADGFNPPVSPINSHPLIRTPRSWTWKAPGQRKFKRIIEAKCRLNPRFRSPATGQSTRCTIDCRTRSVWSHRKIRVRETTTEISRSQDLPLHIEGRSLQDEDNLWAADPSKPLKPSW